METNKHAEVIVKGRVQGVYFRVSAQKEAQRLGLKGYVKNNKDGTVFISVEGEPSKLEVFFQWCRVGPPSAHVESIHADYKTFIGYTEFAIR